MTAPDSSSMRCAEKESLTEVYLAATAMMAEAGKLVDDVKSPAWRVATGQSRLVCKKAMAALQAHTAEHGC